MPRGVCMANCAASISHEKLPLLPILLHEGAIFAAEQHPIRKEGKGMPHKTSSHFRKDFCHSRHSSFGSNLKAWSCHYPASVSDCFDKGSLCPAKLPGTFEARSISTRAVELECSTNFLVLSSCNGEKKYGKHSGQLRAWLPQLPRLDLRRGGQHDSDKRYVSFSSRQPFTLHQPSAV